MKAKRKRHSVEFKGKVALEALKGLKTVSELSTDYGVHSTQISQWKTQLKAGIREIFGSRRGKGQQQERETVEATLYEEIGRLKVELDWLKKNMARLELR